MTTLVGLNIVIAAVLGVLALLCAAASVTLGRNATLAWVSGALVNGTVQTLIVTFGAGTAIEFFSAAVLAPLGFLLAGQAIAALVPGLPGRRMVIATVATLSATAVMLCWFGAPIAAQAAAFELACIVAMLDAAWRLQQRAFGQSHLLTALTIMVYVLAGFTVLRLAALPVHIGADATFLSFSRSSSEALFLSAASLLTPIIIILLLARVITATIETFQHQSEHDSLTGLFNRRMMDAMTAEYGRSGAVIFCDIDHFKRVNDLYGHEAGDQVIRSFALLLNHSGHVAGRIGGEEFALLLPGCAAQEAADIAEGIRIAFHQLTHATLPEDERLSASFGVAVHKASEPVRKAFARADSALYAAKAAGRNRVVVHNPHGHVPGTGSYGEQRAA